MIEEQEFCRDDYVYEDGTLKPDLCSHSMYGDCGYCEYYFEDECTHPTYEYMEISLKQLFKYSVMHKGVLHGILHALKELFIELYHQIHFQFSKLRKNRRVK